MNYTVVQESRIGGRETNQDRVAWLATDDALLMAVADGMGGHLQGEVAAQIAVDTLMELFRNQAKTRLADPAWFLAGALKLAHETIVRYSAACRIAPHAAPRTTCIACVVQDGKAVWAHAGDSRLYLIHGHAPGAEGLVQSRDHSVVQRMVDAGSLSHAEAVNHPLRNRVFSCLGGDAPPHIEVSPAVALSHGDVIVLCTDGVWSPLGERLASELRRAPLNTGVPDLLDAAESMAGPGADNLTLIAMRWEATVALAEAAAQPAFCDTYIGEAPLSDEEIARAIVEIRRRLPQSPNGASS